MDDDLLFEHIALDIAQGAGDFDGAVVVETPVMALAAEASRLQGGKTIELAEFEK